MAYCTADDVNVYLGETLSSASYDAAAALVEGASDFIDQYTGRTWVPGTVTGEVHRVVRGFDGEMQVVLDRPPVSGITTISKRGPTVGSTVKTLTSPSGYTLLNPARGLLIVAATDGDYVTVTYTAAPVVPADIITATTMLVAGWIQPAGDPSGLNLKSLKAGSAQLVWRDVLTGSPLALEILKTYRAGVTVA